MHYAWQSGCTVLYWTADCYVTHSWFATSSTWLFYLIVVWTFYFLQALWQLLWVNPTASSNFSKSVTSTPANKKHAVEFIQQRVGIVASELLSQVTNSFCSAFCGCLWFILVLRALLVLPWDMRPRLCWTVNLILHFFLLICYICSCKIGTTDESLHPPVTFMLMVSMISSFRR